MTPRKEFMIFFSSFWSTHPLFAISGLTGDRIRARNYVGTEKEGNAQRNDRNTAARRGGGGGGGGGGGQCGPRERALVVREIVVLFFSVRVALCIEYLQLEREKRNPKKLRERKRGREAKICHQNFDLRWVLTSSSSKTSASRRLDRRGRSHSARRRRRRLWLTLRMSRCLDLIVIRSVALALSFAPPFVRLSLLRQPVPDQPTDRPAACPPSIS